MLLANLTVFILAALITIFLYCSGWSVHHYLVRRRLKRQILALQEYKFPETVRAVFRRENPNMTSEQEDLAFDGLKQYFMVALLNNAQLRPRSIGMPSVLVDEAWHSFVLCTLPYDRFCKKFFGKLLHHHPDTNAEPTQLSATSKFKSDVTHTWSTVQRGRRLYPAYFRVDADDVPLLFAADTLGGIHGGWIWSAEAIKNLAEQSKAASGGQSDTSSDLGFLTGGACFGSPGGGSTSPSGDSGASCGSSCSSAGSGSSCSSGSSCGGGGGGCGGD